jgi:hypothetical protein
MSEHQARFARDVYDHEHDEPRPFGRRRAVADWDVGEELFDHLPRRRFTRGSDGRPRERRPAGRPDRTAPREIPRGGADDGRRTIAIDKPEDVPSEIAALTADRDLGGVDDLTPANAAIAGADELGPTGRAGDLAPAGRVDDLAPTGRADDLAPAWRADDLAATGRGDQPRRGAGPPQRRTVTISGRPEGARRAPRAATGPQRLQPPRTVAERMGARPERLAAWAFALGLLLILIAVITAG